LGGFDEQLRREQQRTAQERDSHATQRADGAGTGTGSGTAEESSRSRSGEINRDRSGDLRSEGKPSGDSSGEAQKSGEQGGTAMPQGGGGAATKALPSGADDDIIARRLRKAAEAETDPELKEKLWKEYRDYKENTRGGS
jgi:hypothetical protein